MLSKFKSHDVQTTGLTQCISMDDSQFGLVSSIFTLGGLLGALSGGPISTRYGRLLAMRLTSVVYIIGSVMEALSTNIPVMAIGRIFSGIGAGASTVIVPLYIAEIAPPNEKGLFGALTQITINIGILFTQVLGYFLSRGSMWRIILGVGAGLGALQGLGLFIIPESPAWLANHKNPQQAVKNLQRIRGRDVSIKDEIAAWDVPIDPSEEEEGLLSSPNAAARPSSIRSNSSKKSVAQVSIYQAFKDPLYRPAIIAVVGVMTAQQFTGINSIIMYSVSLLSTILPTTSALLTILVSLVNLVVTVLCSPLADRLGRKRCLLLSITGMGTSSLLLAFSILFSQKILSAISVVLFVAAFGVGLGPVPFILSSELVGQEAVGATQSVALAANWIATFIVAQFFPMLNSWLGGNGYVYFIFAGMAVLYGVFVAAYVPETKGMRDADEVWGRTRRVD